MRKIFKFGLILGVLTLIPRTLEQSSQVALSKRDDDSSYIQKQIKKAERRPSSKKKYQHKVTSSFRPGFKKPVPVDREKQKQLRAEKLAKLKESRSIYKASMYEDFKNNSPFAKDPKHVLVGMDPESGLPIFYSRKNLNSAVTTGTNLIQNSPYNLNGTGLSVGIWDGGAIFTDHVEYEATSGGASLISPRDSATIIDPHACHVTGTVMAQGINPAAKGMAFGAAVELYDFDDDVAEMTSAAYNQFSGLGVLTSNHSYAISVGWFSTFVDRPFSLRESPSAFSPSKSSKDFKPQSPSLSIDGPIQPGSVSVAQITVEYTNTGIAVTDGQAGALNLVSEVFGAPPLDHILRITNTGTSTLTLTNFNFPTQYFLVSPSSLAGTINIAAGNSLDITFNLNADGTGNLNTAVNFDTNVGAIPTFDFNMTQFIDPEVWVWAGDTTISQVEDAGFGRYGDTSRDFDQIAYLSPYYTIVLVASNDRADQGPTSSNPHHFAFDPAFNDFVASTTARNPDDFDNGGFDTLPPDTVAKNALTIGAVPSITGGYTSSGQVVETTFSSYGPTDDGRIKPDLVAPGVSVESTGFSAGDYRISTGTSMAAPAVTGIAALLRKYFQSLYNRLPFNATMKALLIHTANEAGPAAGPDYKFGWGLVNAKGAADFLAADDGLENNVVEDTLASGETKSYTLSSSGNPVKITMVWNDPAGTVPALSLDSPQRAIVNDLNLTLTDSNGATFFPWVLDRDNPASPAIRGVNNKDNVEQIVLDFNPAPRQTYTLTVSHAGNLTTSGTEPEQDFSLMLEGFDFSTSSSGIEVTNSTGGNTPIVDGQATPIDFGTITQGLQGNTIQFQVRNTGNINLALSNLSVPSGFVIIKDIATSLAPGATDTFEVRLDSSTLGTFSGQINLTTNIPGTETFNFSITGAVTSTSSSGISVVYSNSSTVISDGQTSTLDLGTESINATATDHTFTITNTGADVLNLSNLQVPTGFDLVSSFATAVSTGNSTTFTIRANTFTAGIKSGTLSFETNVSGQETFNFNISASVVDASSLSISVVHTNTNTTIINNQSTAINTGAILSGSTGISQVFTITNTGTSDLTLGSLTLPPGYIIVESLPTTISPSGSRTFQIRLDSSGVGTFAGTVSFTTNVPGNEIFSFPITGEVSTVSPTALVTYTNQNITVSDNSITALDLGDEVLGGSSTIHTFTVTNGGNTALTTSNLLVPSGFILVEGLSGSLEKGQSDTFQIRVDTGTIGTYQGELRFNTNVTSQNPFNFIIKAQVATVPDFGYSIEHTNESTTVSNGVTTINLGTEEQFSASTIHTFRLTNLGANILNISQISVPQGVVISRNFNSSVEFNQTTQLEVRLATLFTQSVDGVITFQTNDPNNSKYQFRVQGTVNPSSSSGNTDEDSGSSSSGRQGDEALACATIALDSGNGPKNGPFQVTLGFLLALVLNGIRRQKSHKKSRS